jgi:uncharacterized membrane protein YcaP (DUF421 family)
MKKHEIEITDIKRILLGSAPAEFLIEVFLRTLVLYIALLFIVRWLGKRMAGQLTVTEMAVMLTLGAILSPAMQIPERGILITMIVLVCGAMFQRGLNFLSFKYERIEKIITGKVTLLVEDGIMKVQHMKATRITHQQLYAHLRKHEIVSLGSVETVYLEACGLFSVFKSKEKKPGLPVLPPNDVSVLNNLPKKNEEHLSCCYCGNTVKKNNNGTCEVCGEYEWTTSVI